MATVIPESLRSDENPPETATSPDATEAAEAARRRAAAYLDLWERQLVHLAAEGAPPPGPVRARRPVETR